MIKIAAALALTAMLAACAPATGSTALPSDAVRHVVVFKFRPGTTDAQIQQVTDEFRALQDRIPGIIDFEYGINDSPEGHDQGFTHVYLMTFANAAARDTYLPHPEHEEFGRMLGGMNILEEVFVVDYVPQQ